MKIIKEALQKLKEENELTTVNNRTLATADDLNAKLLKKINVIADALRQAFREEGIDLDADLIAQDIIRDCGLMGGIRSTDELDVENNPFDAATKEMHDMGPVNPEMACKMLLDVPPHEFVAVFIDGLKRNKGLLPGPNGRRELPNRPAPRMIGRRGFREAIEKDYPYIDVLVRRYAPKLDGLNEANEELLTEKITDIKAYYNGARNKERFENIKMSEKDLFRLAEVDPTYKKGSNGAGTYLEWLLRLITNGTTTFKDILAAEHEYHDQLDAFERLKKRKRLPENKRDIMQVADLRALMELVATRGDENVEPEENQTMSDFKQDLKDFPAFCQKIGWPEAVRGSADEHLEFVGENGTWEIWKVKSPLGAYIFDQWGSGAKWCVGGFGYRGEDGYRDANRYYNNYLHGGEGVYVCFQKKNANEPRPYNKALITFDDAARYEVSQFNHANNSSYYSNDYSGDTAAEFARFLQEEGLLDVLKKTEFGNCESIKDAEMAEALSRGEPYIYNGETIKSQFKDKIKKIVFEEGYDRKIFMSEGGQRNEIVGIPQKAFAGCTNLEEVDLPITVVGIGYGAFMGCDKVKILTPHHRMLCHQRDIEFLSNHIIETDAQ